jgi:hypothetical protein
VQIDRALGDAGALRDVVESRPCKTARREFIERSFEDGDAPGGGALGSPGARLRRWGFGPNHCGRFLHPIVHYYD